MSDNIAEQIEDIADGQKCSGDCKPCFKSATIYALINYIGLTLFKGFVGYFTGSKALIADAMHSSSDALTAIAGTIGMKISGRPKDKTHPYGYGKIEFVIGLLVGSALLVASLDIIFVSAKVIWIGQPIKAPNIVSLIVPIIAIYANYVVSKLTMCAAEHSSSPIIKAVSTDIRSDMYASIPVVIALVGAQLGFPFLDPLGGVVVGFLILKASWGILSENYGGLVDASIDKETIEEIKEAVSLVSGIKALDYVKARKTGSKIWVDVGIFLSRTKTVEESDEISLLIRNAIKHKLPESVDNVQVCVSPA